MIVTRREETGFLKIVYHLALRSEGAWGPHMGPGHHSVIAHHVNRATRPEGGGTRKRRNSWGIICTPSAHLTPGLALIRPSCQHPARSGNNAIIGLGACGTCSRLLANNLSRPVARSYFRNFTTLGPGGGPVPNNDLKWKYFEKIAGE